MLSFYIKSHNKMFIEFSNLEKYILDLKDKIENYQEKNPIYCVNRKKFLFKIDLPTFK